MAQYQLRAMHSNLKTYYGLHLQSYILQKDVAKISKVPGAQRQWCKSLLSIGGDNLHFYPNFALFLTLREISLDQDFFQMSKLSEDQKKKERFSIDMEHFFSSNSGEDQKTKKRSSPEMEHLFSPNSSTDLRSDAHQSQIIGGDADDDHTQIVGGIQSNYWGDISPSSPPPPGFRHHCPARCKSGPAITWLVRVTIY